MLQLLGSVPIPTLGAVLRLGILGRRDMGGNWYWLVAQSALILTSKSGSFSGFGLLKVIAP